MVVDRILLKFIFVLIGFLICGNVLLVPFADDLESIDGHLGLIIEQIDLNSEKNFATWCSSMFLLLNSIGAYFLARKRWPATRRVAMTTAIISLGFFLLSIDDFIGFHEYIEYANLFGSNGEQTLNQIPGPLFALLLAIILAGLCVGPYMRSIQRKNIPFLIGTIVCVFSVALTEFLYNQSWCEKFWCFRLEVVFEEGCELLAIFLFLLFQSRELEELNEDMEANYNFK